MDSVELRHRSAGLVDLAERRRDPTPQDPYIAFESALVTTRGTVSIFMDFTPPP